MRAASVCMSLIGCMCLAGCEQGAGVGGVQVLVQAEDSITIGINAGDAVEDIRDGWNVTFGAYDMVVEGVDLRLATDHSQLVRDSNPVAVELAKIAQSGQLIYTFDELKAGDWQFSYSGGTFSINGVLAKPDGESCPPVAIADPGLTVPNLHRNQGGDTCYDNPEISFAFAIDAPTTWGPCEIDEVPGFTIPDGGSQTVAITIHGDHLFFNGFPEGGEGGIMRLAQWLADCDLNLDGVVSEAELAAISLSDLAEIDGRYQLGGSPITPLANMLDYLGAQLMTQGHFQGEGECPIN